MALCRRPVRASLALALACSWICAPAALAQAPALPPDEQAAASELAALEASLDDVAHLVLDAHFRTAVGVAEAARSRADAIPSSPEVREARSRLQVLLATAWIALDEKEAARESMRRAVSVWPLLTLHERTTSPRVLALYHAVRSTRAERRAP